MPMKMTTKMPAKSKVKILDLASFSKWGWLNFQGIAQDRQGKHICCRYRVHFLQRFCIEIR